MAGEVSNIGLERGQQIQGFIFENGTVESVWFADEHQTGRNRFITLMECVLWHIRKNIDSVHLIYKFLS